MIASLPSSEGRPSKLPELTIVPASTKAPVSGSPSPVRRRDHGLDGQPELPRELEVAVVVRGTAITAPVP